MSTLTLIMMQYTTYIPLLLSTEAFFNSDSKREGVLVERNKLSQGKRFINYLDLQIRCNHCNGVHDIRTAYNVIDYISHSIICLSQITCWATI